MARPWLPLVLICAGCGHAEPVARVAGTVTYMGQPVENALVIFSSDSLGIHVTAKVENGRYTVRRKGVEGIPPGEYRVAVSPPIEDHPVGPILQPPQRTRYANIPDKYHRPETSGFAARLKEGVNTLDLEMNASRP